MFLGFVEIESAIPIVVLAKNGNAPVALDAAPTFRVYGPAGLMANGTGTLPVYDGTVTGLYGAQFTPSAANGFASGQTYTALIRGTISAAAWGDSATFVVT
jgi:hypothetical protein